MESVELGKKAVALSEEGVTASMVIMNRVSDDPYTIEYGYAEIKNIANEARSDSLLNGSIAAGNDVTQELIDYLTPLIQGESNVTYENGLPVYMDVSHSDKTSINFPISAHAFLDSGSIFAAIWKMWNIPS